MSEPPRRPSVPPLTPSAALAALLFLFWLWGGYTAILTLTDAVRLRTAAGEAALCLLVAPVILFAVVHFIALPKPFTTTLPRAVIELLWLLGNVSEVVIPWLGWAALLWIIHRGRAGALLPAACLALFSYLTGIAILLFFRPRAGSVQITRLELPIPNLPRAFDGYRLLHLSDLHVGGFSTPAHARERVAVARGLEADLLVFTGDLTGHPGHMRAAVEIVAGLSGRDGGVAVMGNHDNWSGAAHVTAALRAGGLVPLVNEHLTVRRGDACLHIAGVDNPAYTDRDDLAAALAGVGEEEVVILLSHAPEIMLRPLASRASLILCGHTHGGQIVLPLVGPVYVPSKVGRRYPSGLFPCGDGWLFVTRGLGEIFPPLRVLCPPEVALITLRASGRPG